MRTLVARSCAFALIAGLATTIWGADASAITHIDSCQFLTKHGETYVVTSDVTTVGTCLFVANDRITIDLGGHQIFGHGSGAGVTDGGLPRLLTTVKNGDISGFETGIDLASSTRNQVLNMSVGFNAGDGIRVGTKSLVKTCSVRFNEGHGVSVGDYGQVESCVALGNGADGIVGASHVLITKNTSEENLGNGITTGTFGTVTRNESSNNTVDGINADASSLVTLNLANDNGVIGIGVACPSTVTNNMASGNDQNYSFNGPGCFTNNNR